MFSFVGEGCRRFKSLLSAGLGVVAGFVVSAVGCVVLVAMLVGMVSFLSPPKVEAADGVSVTTQPEHCWTDQAKGSDGWSQIVQEGFCVVDGKTKACEGIVDHPIVCDPGLLPTEDLVCVNSAVTPLNDTTTCGLPHGILVRCQIVSNTAGSSSFTGDCVPSQPFEVPELPKRSEDPVFWEHNCTTKAASAVKVDALCVAPGHKGQVRECHIHYVGDDEQKPECQGVYMKLSHKAPDKYCEAVGSNAHECQVGAHTALCFNSTAIPEFADEQVYLGDCRLIRPGTREYLDPNEAQAVMQGAHANATFSNPERCNSVITFFEELGVPYTFQNDSTLSLEEQDEWAEAAQELYDALPIDLDALPIDPPAEGLGGFNSEDYSPSINSHLIPLVEPGVCPNPSTSTLISAVALTGAAALTGSLSIVFYATGMEIVGNAVVGVGVTAMTGIGALAAYRARRAAIGAPDFQEAIAPIAGIARRVVPLTVTQILEAIDRVPQRFRGQLHALYTVIAQSEDSLDDSGAIRLVTAEIHDLPTEAAAALADQLEMIPADAEAVAVWDEVFGNI